MKKSSFWTIIVLIFICGLFFLCLKSDSGTADKNAAASDVFLETSAGESEVMAWGDWVEQNIFWERGLPGNSTHTNFRFSMMQQKNVYNVSVLTWLCLACLLLCLPQRLEPSWMESLNSSCHIQDVRLRRIDIVWQSDGKKGVSAVL